MRQSNQTEILRNPRNNWKHSGRVRAKIDELVPADQADDCRSPLTRPTVDMGIIVINV
jgi:hypothetical protein